MREEQNLQEIGRQLGFEGVERVVGQAQRFADCERQRLELTNRAPIISLQANIALLREREASLQERLRHAPPAGDLRSRRRQALYDWAVTALLTVAGFFLSIIALDPFRLGWKSILYCLGIAVVTPFSVEKFLECFGKAKVVKTLAATASVAAISGLMLLAVIRGNVLSQQIMDQTPVIVSGDEQPAPTSPSNTFYDTTVSLLCVVMVLLSLAMELAAGFALHDARRLSQESGEDPKALTSELAVVHNQMLSCLHELTNLENQSAEFVARFWRDFYRSLLTHAAKNALGKLLALGLGLSVLLSLPNRALAADRLNLVVLVDLTQSVAVKGHDGKSESQKNFQAVSQTLAQVPAGAHVTVLGITDNSFAQPYILLQAEVGVDEGYFKEKLASARWYLVSRWQSRARTIKTGFAHTDILGALLLADQLFHDGEHTERQVLFIFSDMRQNTPDLDLETVAAFDAKAALARTEKRGLTAHLSIVEVHILGVDGAGKSITYWEHLREFWLNYFQQAGAHVLSYSALRELPTLDSSPYTK